MFSPTLIFNPVGWPMQLYQSYVSSLIVIIMGSLLLSILVHVSCSNFLSIYDGEIVVGFSQVLCKYLPLILFFF